MKPFDSLVLYVTHHADWWLMVSEGGWGRGVMRRDRTTKITRGLLIYEAWESGLLQRRRGGES